MPLRDHFRPPLDDKRHWQGFHGVWPAMIIVGLQDKLPDRYFAEPNVQIGGSAEIDIGTFHDEDDPAQGKPPQASLSVVTDLPAPEEYEVRVFDTKRNSRLVAAIEIISPANKDRPEHRRAFVAKCAALLQNRVSVILIDLVTTRHFNFYQELLELIGQTDATQGTEPPPLYAVACRGTRKGQDWLLETWTHELTLGQPLPILPLWLADDLAIALDLEEPYKEACRILRIP